MIPVTIFVFTCFAFAHVSVQETIVIDSGSRYVKSGLAEDERPRSIMSNVIGESKTNDWGFYNQQIYVGNEAESHRSILNLKYPMSDGYIKYPDKMKIVWEHIFEEELRISPSQGPVTLTYAPLAASAMTDRMRSIMLNMGAPSVTLVNTALMTLRFSGRETGLVIETGSQGTFVVPVYQGSPIDSATVKVDVAGQDISIYLTKLLQEEGTSLMSMGADSAIIDDIKAKVCYVAQNYETESASIVLYEMRWGDIVPIGDAQFKAPELLFQPYLNGIESVGLIEAVSYAINYCDSSIQGQLWANIVLGGGNSMLNGLAERLDSDLSALTRYAVNIYALDGRDVSAWKGAADFSY
ncbi:actin-6-like [Convolutriloba macropyga]|uniref:actin-6-like n=1 Tax=Convolutriloba macropyga TaxID=536237 RepID=UPI003F520B52